MKTRLLIITGMFLLTLVLPQGFSQCIYNDDWPDAPCFDMGPVSHLEFNEAWALYYDHKGSEWMDAKGIEMNQSLEQGVLEEWTKELENNNVYQYFLSRNEIQSQFQYDKYSVTLDPNFINPEPIEPTLTKEQLADAPILCIKGYKQVGSECVQNKDLKIFNYEIFYIVLLIVLTLISFVIIYVWRKRK